MGVINLSPESFYKGSIKTGPGNILQTAIRQVKEGADIIDIGAKSTAPYLETEITPEAETDRALEEIKKTGIEDVVYKSAGPLLIKSKKDDVIKELEEKKE